MCAMRLPSYFMPMPVSAVNIYVCTVVSTLVSTTRTCLLAKKWRTEVVNV